MNKTVSKSDALNAILNSLSATSGDIEASAVVSTMAPSLRRGVGSHLRRKRALGIERTCTVQHNADARPVAIIAGRLFGLGRVQMLKPVQGRAIHQLLQIFIMVGIDIIDAEIAAHAHSGQAFLERVPPADPEHQQREDGELRREPRLLKLVEQGAHGGLAPLGAEAADLPLERAARGRLDGRDLTNRT